MRRDPLDPRLVVYSAYWGTAFSCNPRAVYLAMRELRPDLHAVWVMKAGSEGVVPDGVDVVVEGTGEYYRAMARATYFVNNVNFANDVVKRPGQIHLQTHHGTPLKTMGLDLVNAAHSSLGLNFRRLMKRVQRWDYSISANEFTTEIWERVYPSGTYESLETGYPRNDELIRATDADRARIRADLGISEDARVLLYTPTHREYSKQYVPLLDPVALAESLGPTWTILMRSHYFYRDAATGSHPRVVDVANHRSIEELSIASDVLVTDYSSLMFDFAVLDRPIVIYAPDWDEYRTQRGTYFDLMAEPPGSVATTQEELARLLIDGRHEDAASTAARTAFRARFAALEDGGAARRVVEAVWPATH
jgi:CDP-glycerol glycerophosphotransferase